MNDDFLSAAPQRVRDTWLQLNERQRALAVALPASASTEAAMLLAGYAAQTARKKNGAIPVGVQVVAAYIAGTAIERSVVDVARLVSELAHTALLDPVVIFDENDNVKPVTQWPEHARRALSGIDVFEEYQGAGKDREYVGRTKKLKFLGKVDAARELLKVLGGYAPEKHEHQHRIAGMADLLKEIAGADCGIGSARSRST